MAEPMTHRRCGCPEQYKDRDCPACRGTGLIPPVTRAEWEQSQAEAGRMREALEIIAGRRELIDNVLSNVRIAELALALASQQPTAQPGTCNCGVSYKMSIVDLKHANYCPLFEGNHGPAGEEK